MDLVMSKTATVPANGIRYAIGTCALGRLLVARSASGICAILMGDDDGALATDLAGQFPEMALSANEVLLQGDLAKVVRFVDSPADGPDLPLDLRGTPFQRRVWAELRTIPIGRTVTYAELAVRLGDSHLIRAVAGACAANPIALAVPCHRVLRSDGGLAGYRWGIERKCAMINKEAGA